MIIDSNSYLGRWGLRTKGITKVEEFLKIMDKNKIDISVVTSTVALVTDTKEGNLWLIKEIFPYRNRFIPVACINPIWGLKETMEYFDKYPFKIARISPSLHNYSLKDIVSLNPFMDLFKEENIPLYITVEVCYNFCSIANKMGFSPPIYPISEIINFAEQYSSQKIVICGYDTQLFSEVNNLFIPSFKKCKNLFIEISDILVAGVIEKLVKEIPNQILLGTGNAINEPSGSIYKVKFAKITDEEKEKILFRNAEKVFSSENVIKK